MQQYIDKLLEIKNSTDINYGIMMCTISSRVGQQYLNNEITKDQAKTYLTNQLQAAELKQISDSDLKLKITAEMSNMLNFLSN